MDPTEPTTSEPPATIPPPVDPKPPLPQPQQESSSAPPPQPMPPPAATPPSIPPTISETPTQTPTTQTPRQQQPHSQTQPKPQFQPQPLTQPSQNQRPHMPLPSLTRTATRPPGSFSHFHPKAPSSAPSTSSAIAMPPPSQTTSTTAMQRGGLATGVPAAAHPRSGPVPFSSFGPAPSFGQSFGAGISEQSSTSSPNPQTRPPTQGIQNIGMIGSLNTASHTRHASTQLHQRPAQPTLRSITPGSPPSPNIQKLPNQALTRVSSLGSPASGPAQNTRPLHQPWMSSQARPVHALSLSSTSYRPPVRPQNLQQRPTQQPQQQYQIPQKQLQQQQKQQQASHPHQPLGTQIQQQPLAKNHSSMPQQQPAPRAASQKLQVPITAQPGSLQPGTPFPVVNSEDADSGGHILSKRSIRELVSQVDPSEKLDPEVEDILVEIADDFIESITTVACSLAKHRKSNTLEAKDILLHLERNWNITLPGFGGDEIKGYKKPSAADVVHKERLAVIKKSMAAIPDTGNTKNSTPGQSNTNVKSHVTKAPLVGSPKLL